MEHSMTNQRGQGTTRRAFLKQVLTLTSIAASTGLLNACGASGTTATAVPPIAQPPTTLPTNAPASTTAATAGAVSTPASGAAPTGEATAAATTPAASSTGQEMTPKIVAVANAFLATLSDTEKGTVL